MSSPTDEQILCVKDNLRNLITFNDQLYVQGQTKILNAYALLTISDDHDPALVAGLNILKSAYLGIGDIGGPIGVFVSSFACCILDSYTTTTPASLNAQMSSMLMRFQKTSEQLDVDFEMYCNDPVTYWNTSFTGSVTNAFGTYPVSCNFSDLATIKFPAITDPEFMEYLLKAQYGLDQQIWFTLLPNYKITQFLPSTDYPCSRYTEQQLESNAAGFYGVQAACFLLASKYDAIYRQEASWTLKHPFPVLLLHLLQFYCLFAIKRHGVDAIFHGHHSVHNRIEYLLC
jgi:hypothetical protein